MNNCKSPLKLTWDEEYRIYEEYGIYKVNKTGIQSGEYVDKRVADELLAACEWAKEQFKRLADDGRYPEFMLTQNGGNGIMPIISAIKLANN